MPESQDTLKLPEDEIGFSVSTSSGPGGQNVNRVRTRVTLAFNVLASPSLTEEQRARIARRLGSRLDKNGILRVRSQKHRTQGKNRAEALARLMGILNDALEETPERRRTRKPRAAEERRLEEKRRRSQLKKFRTRTESPGD